MEWNEQQVAFHNTIGMIFLMNQKVNNANERKKNIKFDPMSSTSLIHSIARKMNMSTEPELFIFFNEFLFHFAWRYSPCLMLNAYVYPIIHNECHVDQHCCSHMFSHLFTKLETKENNVMTFVCMRREIDIR